jgi:hypothetical protein
MDIQKIKEKVSLILRQNNVYHDIYVNCDGTIGVEVVWGDWKHDHIYLDKIMQKNGYKLIDETTTEEDGSDTYSAIHTFVKL